jgi:hypothetical protein
VNPRDASSTTRNSAVVVGSTLLILIALAHQSLRGGRLAAQAADEDATADVR